MLFNVNLQACVLRHGFEVVSRHNFSPIRHFFNDITHHDVPRVRPTRGIYRAERSNLQSEPPSPCARHSYGGRGEQGGRVLVGQAVRLGHRARNQLAAERAQPLRQGRVGRGRAGHPVCCDAKQVGQGDVRQGEGRGAGDPPGMLVTQ